MNKFESASGIKELKSYIEFSNVTLELLTDQTIREQNSAIVNSSQTLVQVTQHLEAHSTVFSNQVKELQSKIMDLQPTFQKLLALGKEIEIDSQGADEPKVTQNPKSVPQVERVSVKLPPFWDEMPEIWFAQAEAEFEVSQIVRERTRYSYLMGALPRETLMKVVDIIKVPHPTTPYTHLKEQVLSRLSTSEEARLSKLLYHVEMGDRSPSELYRHMVQLAGGSADLSTTLIQKLWKSRLPKSIEVALIAVDAKEHEEQMKIADRLFECTQSGSVAEMESKPTSSSFHSNADDIRREISELRNMVRQMASQPYRQSRRYHRTRSNSRNRRNIPSQQKERTLCWYHHKFGENANKCNKPCNFFATQGKNNAHQKN